MLIKAVGVHSVKGTILNNDICVHFHKKIKFIKQPLKRNFVIFTISVSKCVVLRWIWKKELVVWELPVTKHPLEQYNTNNVQVNLPACRFENHKIKLSFFLYWDLEEVAYQYDTAQKCVKAFYHELQLLKPDAQRHQYCCTQTCISACVKSPYITTALKDCFHGNCRMNISDFRQINL